MITQMKVKTMGNKKIINSWVPKRSISGKPLLSKRVSQLHLIHLYLEKRLKKERKIKEKEIKKLRALNGGEESAEGDIAGGSTRSRGSSQTPGEDDDDQKSESSSSSSDSSSDDSKANTAVT